MIAAAFLAAAAAAAPDAPPRVLPKGSRFSGELHCRFPADGPLKRGVLLSLDDAEGAERVVFRGIDGRGVVADERVLTLTKDESGLPPSRRRRSKMPPARYAFLTNGDPVVSGTLAVDDDGRSVDLRAKRTAEPSMLGGACEGVFKLEKPK